MSAPTIAVKCDRCSQDATRIYCDDCYEEKLEGVTESALVGYVPDDELPEVNAEAVRKWLDRERLKPETDLSAETIAVFERCIDDLR